MVSKQVSAGNCLLLATIQAYGTDNTDFHTLQVNCDAPNGSNTLSQWWSANGSQNQAGSVISFAQPVSFSGTTTANIVCSGEAGLVVQERIELLRLG